MNPTISINLDNLDISEESKTTIATLKQIPIIMVLHKLAIVDEIFFLMNKTTQEEKGAIYKLCNAINKSLNKKL